MLMLTRKAGESIVIGNNIVINIVSIQGKNVRIGVEAPKDVSIYRGEIYNKIVRERLVALSMTSGQYDTMIDELEEQESDAMCSKV
jgi:carbon storage regulator